LLLSRVIGLAFLILIGLPILSALQFLGGIDPNLLLAGFAVTCFTLLSIGSLGVLCSVYARRPQGAVLLTYVTLVSYMVLSSLSETIPYLLSVTSQNWVLFVTILGGPHPITVSDIVTGIGSGNPLVMTYRLIHGLAGANFNALLWECLWDYGLFHGLATLALTTWAVLRVRAVTLRSLAAPARRLPGRAGETRTGRHSFLAGGAGPGRWPLLWKEIVVPTRTGRRLVGVLLRGMLAALLFLPAIHIWYFFGRILPLGPADELSGLMNLWVRAISTLLGGYLLLQVAARAATCLTGERAKQTLDGLLATPLSNRNILLSKWLGSIFCPRGAWLWLGIVWGTGILTGGLHAAAVPGYLLTWLAYAAALASLGLWFSVDSRSTRRALCATLLSVAFVLLCFLVGGWDVAGCWVDAGHVPYLWPSASLGVLLFSSGSGRWFCPEFAFLALLESEPHTRTMIIEPEGTRLWLVLVPVSISILAAIMLGILAGSRFRRLTHRAPGEAALMAREPSESAPGVAGQQPGVLSADKLLFQDSAGRVLGRLWLLRIIRAALVVLPLVLIMAWHWQIWVQGRDKARRAAAEADRLDPGWRLEELEARRALVADEENSASTIEEAARLLPDRFYEQLEHSFSWLRAPEQWLGSEDRAALALNLKRDTAALPVARRLADLPHGRFAITYSPDGRSTRTSHVAHCESVANLLLLDAVSAADKSDGARALDSCRALLNAGRGIGDEPLLWSQVTRGRIRLLVVRAAERALAQGQAGEVSLAALQTLVARESREPVLLIALRGSRATDYQLLQSFLRGDSHLKVLDYIPGGGVEALVVALLSRPLEAEEGSLLAYDTQVVETAQLPETERRLELARLWTTRPNSLFLGSVTWPIGRLVEGFFDDDAELRCLLVALAAERYRLANGRWPGSLRGLVPGQLAQIPVDPFDGKPLRYRRTADGVVIYSIGSDGTDNGGKLERLRPGTPGTDVGVQLWDVARRRQPWKEPQSGSQ
jgi:hypothetical protein